AASCGRFSAASSGSPGIDVTQSDHQTENRSDAGGSVASEGDQPSEDARSAVLAPQIRTVSPVESGQHGDRGVTSPTPQRETRKHMGPNRKSRFKPSNGSSLRTGRQ